MKRNLSLLLCLLMLSTVIINTVSCIEPGYSPSANDSGKNPTPDVDSSESDDKSSIIVPPHLDYGRDTVSFNDIEYSRPDANSLIEGFNNVAELITEGKEEYDALLNSICALEPEYSKYSTMFNYAYIMNSKDKSNAYWNEEYDFISSSEPQLIKAVEALFVAAATSEHSESFETDYFGVGALAEYKDGGKFTDTLVKLLEKETELENQYSSLSTATVKITYKGKTDTAEAHINRIDTDSAYGEAEREAAKKQCLNLYEREYNRISKDILVELVKIRSRIATEYGYDSYANLAYEEYGREYSERDAKEFVESLAKYVLPVYLKLNYSVFLPFFNSVSESTKINAARVINSLYDVYEDIDSDLHTVYSYMLEYDLYDYAPSNLNRFEGSFTTYLDDYGTPFVFISANENESDFISLSHEFGHFYDAFVNYGVDASLDLAEVSSISLEFITLLGLEDKLDQETYKYLYYTALDSAMNAIIMQGYYALFEQYAYSIPYSMINEATLTEAARSAAEAIGLSSTLNLDSVLIPHTVLYPFYVQSYCTATTVALEIFYKECERSGDGLAAYKSLVLRETDGLSFLDELKEAGLTSPFSKDYAKLLADKIHYNLLGSHYYKSSSNESNAA